MKTVNSILLIDDDPIANFINSRMLQKILVIENIKTAINGYEGWNVLDEYICAGNCPQIIFLDLNMPVSDGFEFLINYSTLPKSIKEKIKVFVLTTSQNKWDQKRVRETGDVCDYIMKPLTKNILIDIIDRHL